MISRFKAAYFNLLTCGSGIVREQLKVKGDCFYAHIVLFIVFLFTIMYFFYCSMYNGTTRLLVLAGGAGSTYYQGLCMKAVNQSIGRAIRHRKDYATVFLFDERYQQTSVTRQLPEWMRPSLVVPANFQDCTRRVRDFLNALKE